ncbi:hypothetical protein [Limosilactobacillus fermentum]|uniref:hypothetical protein n=1 Tax=Limosilactobacillus fermentum TaxID=1613 RepID=UPI003DA3B0D1
MINSRNLIYTNILDLTEKWTAGPRYLNMTVYHGIEKDDNSEEAGMLKLVK